MFKSTLLAVVVVLLVGTTYAQETITRPIKGGTPGEAKTFSMTLKYDSTINPKRLWYRLDNGKDPVIEDTFGDGKALIIKGRYYSPSAYITIRYMDTTRNIYGNDFFVGDKPASITLHHQPVTGLNNDNNWVLGYTSVKNAILVFDSLDNKRWGRIMKMRNKYSKDVATPLYDFTQRNPNYIRVDSLRILFNNYYKAYIRRDMSYLKQYPNDYYSFWFFINQSSQLDQLLSHDKAFLQEQLTFAKNTFPAKFINSVQGRVMIKKFEAKIKAEPLVMNQPVPAFTVTDINGKTISLNKLKGRYVLLDFWATWCGPCMAEMPFVKDIRKKYPTEKLVVIGISSDTKKQNLLYGIRKNNITWPQYLDIEKNVGTLYSVEDIPTMILLDKEGKMLYRSNFKQSDQDRLPKILESLN